LVTRLRFQKKVKELKIFYENLNFMQKLKTLKRSILEKKEKLIKPSIY